MPRTPTPGITPAQRRLIFGQLRRLAQLSGLSQEDLDDLRRRLTREVSGQDSLRHLSFNEAATVAQRIRAEVQRFTPKRPEASTKRSKRDTEPAKSITPRQQQHLTGLFDLLGWEKLRDRTAFCERQIGRTWPQNNAEFTKVSTPLTEMVLRATDPAEVQRRVEALLDHPALDAWKTNFIADLHRQFQRAEREGGERGGILTAGKLLKLAEAERWVLSHG
jgi:hypothetical protein